MSRPSSRPYDPTARSVMNLIVGEVRPLTTAEDYIFVPSHGPFYVENAVLRSKGLLLKKGKDYEFKALHMSAAQASGKSVACVIQITNKSLFEVTVDYQVVGGRYSEVYSVLKFLIDNMGEPIVDYIPWDNIGDKPEKFNPTAHMHPYWEIAGWEGLLTPLNKILQGVYYRKTKRLRDAYDYYYSKEKAFVENRDSKIAYILKSIEQMQLTNIDPLRIIKIVTDTTPPNAETLGVWETVTTINNDRVLGGAGSTAKHGKTVNLSKDIVYPQPDNIILDEQENPILRDDDEWIYQDNQYPTIPLPGDIVDEDGIEFTAQEWDLFYFKGYHKIAHAGALYASVAADKTQISDGQVVKFKLSSSRYPVGLKVPYQILGVGQANVNVPLTGTITIAANGSAELAVTLVAGSPATYFDVMTFELAIAGGIEASTKYILSTNDTKKIHVDFTANVNDIVKKKALPFEQFFMMVNRTGFLDNDSKMVQLNFTFDDGVKHPIKLDYNTTVVPGVAQTVELDNVQDWFSLQIEPTAAFNSKKLNLNVSYKGRVVESASISLEDVIATVYAVNLETGKPVSEIVDDVPFRFIAETNTTGLLLPKVMENTVGAELSPEINSSVVIENGKAQTPTLTVSRKNRKSEDFVTVRFSTIYGKVLGSYRLKVAVNV